MIPLNNFLLTLIFIATTVLVGIQKDWKLFIFILVMDFGLLFYLYTCFDIVLFSYVWILFNFCMILTILSYVWFVFAFISNGRNFFIKKILLRIVQFIMSTCFIFSVVHWTFFLTQTVWVSPIYSNIWDWFYYFMDEYHILHVCLFEWWNFCFILYGTLNIFLLIISTILIISAFSMQFKKSTIPRSYFNTLVFY